MMLIFSHKHRSAASCRLTANRALYLYYNLGWHNPCFSWLLGLSLITSCRDAQQQDAPILLSTLLAFEWQVFALSQPLFSHSPG